VKRNAFGVRLVIDRSGWTPPGGYQPGHGDSICVSGVCLTVTDADPGTLSFDVIAETLAKTTLGELGEGDGVNLEPAVLPNQPMSGHFLQGHVDTVGTITEVYSGKDEWRTTLTADPAFMDYVVPKGSIAIDGISLTLCDVTQDTFAVALIPTTLDLTTLGRKKPGDRVNLEGDVLVKTVIHTIRRWQAGAAGKSTITMDLLRENGFLAAGQNP
jgi:riboflavin synthase